MKEVSKLLPGYDICIAGGAIRDIILNVKVRDYDVFILFESPPIKPHSEHIVQVFRDEGYETAIKSTSSYALTTIEMFGEKVEICPVIAKNPIALAKGFDWDVCLASAWMTDAVFVDHYEDEVMLDKIRSRSGSLRLMRDSTPDTTLRRGYVFSYRFGLKYNKEDQMHLAKLMLEKNGFKVTPGRKSAHKPEQIEETS